MNGHQETFWGDGNVPNLDCGESYTTLEIYEFIN